MSAATSLPVRAEIDTASGPVAGGGLSAGSRSVLLNTRGAVEPARPPDVPQPAVELPDARPDATPVHLELCLARAPRAHAAAEPREVRPLARETRQQVLKLGELDLHLALEASRPLREDVEDERAPVDDLPVELPLEVALLRGGKRLVEDDHVGLRLLRASADLLHLAVADERGRVDAANRLHCLAHHLDTCGVGETGELPDALVGGHEHARQVGTDQEPPLALGDRGVRPITHRNDVTPAPSTRSTALTIWSVAATRRLDGRATMVSLSSPPRSR